jgi:hypothetical protein
MNKLETNKHYNNDAGIREIVKTINELVEEKDELEKNCFKMFDSTNEALAQISEVLKHLEKRIKSLEFYKGITYGKVI